MRKCKSDPLVDEIELIPATPTYAHDRYLEGRESSAFFSDIAPCPTRHNIEQFNITIPPPGKYDVKTDLPSTGPQLSNLQITEERRTH